MRKSVVILVSAAVLICCLSAAGCVGSTDNPGEQPQGPAEPVQTQLPDAVLTVAVEKTGSAYLPGDSVRLNLPYIAGTEYTWVVTEQAKGLDVQKLDAIYDHEKGFAGGTGVQPFVLSAEKEGTYPVTIKYMRPWEGEESALAEYSDELHVAAKSGEKPLDTPRGAFSYSSWKINPEAGQYVKITVHANPTTGYAWKAAESDDLTVSENYVADNPGLAGSPGTYEWYVTADKAGSYTFSAQCTSPSGEVDAEFSLPLIFVKAEAAE